MIILSLYLNNIKMAQEPDIYQEFALKLIKHVPYMLYVYDPSEKIEHTIDQARQKYKDLNQIDLINSMCFITNNMVCYALFGTLKDKPYQFQNNLENGIYNMVIEPSQINSKFPGHEFLFMVENEIVTILHSYIGRFELKVRIIDKETFVSFLVKLHDKQDSTELYNFIFEVAEAEVPLDNYIHLGCFTAQNNLAELILLADERLAKLVLGAEYNVKNDYYDYYDTLKELYPQISFH